jgi:hypothetical protein
VRYRSIEARLRDGVRTPNVCDDIETVDSDE